MRKNVKSTSVKLTLPAELRRAVDALREMNFAEPGIRELTYMTLDSEVIIYLMRKGLAATEKCIRENVQKVSADCEIWEQIFAFLIKNPAATNVLPAHFPEKSAARNFMIERSRQEERLHQDDDNWTPSLGISRVEASDELSYKHDWLARLVEAQGALQKAISLGP